MTGLAALFTAALALAVASRRDGVPAVLPLLLLTEPLGPDAAVATLAALVAVGAWWRCQLNGVGRRWLWIPALGTAAVWALLPADPWQWRDAVACTGGLLIALLAWERPVDVERGRRWVRRVPVDGPAPME